MSLWQIFRWPLLIGALTAIGLVSGLVSDGWGDAFAALGLFIPAATALWLGTRRIRPASPKPEGIADGPPAKRHTGR